LPMATGGLCAAAIAYLIGVVRARRSPA
jgi:hypothetical protein